jgi:hypothetical protein
VKSGGGNEGRETEKRLTTDDREDSRGGDLGPAEDGVDGKLSALPESLKRARQKNGKPEKAASTRMRRKP